MLFSAWLTPSNSFYWATPKEITFLQKLPHLYIRNTTQLDKARTGLTVSNSIDTICLKFEHLPRFLKGCYLKKNYRGKIGSHQNS